MARVASKNRFPKAARVLNKWLICQRICANVDEFKVRLYESSDFELWNAFVKQAKNATFLFDRRFMEYHADRFQDFSLLIFKGPKLIGLIPAHRSGQQVFSHWGLTYGGMVLKPDTKLSDSIQIFKCILKFLSDNGIPDFFIKEIPSIYNAIFADEMRYALFLADAKVWRRDALSVIDLRLEPAFRKTRRQGIRRGFKNKLRIVEEPDFKKFWQQILEPNLLKKHQAKPVHSFAEMELLHRFFPDNIRHFNVYQNDLIVAGTTIFVSDFVAHPQYVSAREDKNELGSIDFLYNHLITDVFKDLRYFDLGISNEDQGRKLNEGLVFWKESFGAQTLTQDFYEVETANYKRLENVLI